MLHNFIDGDFINQKESIEDRFARKYDINNEKYYAPRSSTPRASQRPAAPAPKIKSVHFEGSVDPARFVNWRSYAHGGHSIIYRALDTETGQEVAIKEHHHYMPEDADDAQAIRSKKKRYESEMSALERLDHPGIVRPVGYFFMDNHGMPIPYLVMEFLPQDSLADDITMNGADEQKVRAMILSVGSVLDYLHTGKGKTIIYRDLRPENIKIMPVEALWPHKVLDFSETRIGNVTSTGSVMGTIGYNAPELLGDGIADPSVDRYSLARIAAHMLIKDNNTFMDNYFGNISLEGLRADGKIRISDELLRVINTATARNPGERHKSFVELANDLGYSIERAPRTREELERISGVGGLPAEIGSQGLEDSLGNVQLTKQEIKLLDKIANSYGISIVAVTGIPGLGATLYEIFTTAAKDLPTGLYNAGMIAAVASVPAGILTEAVTSYVLKKRMLRKKRIEAGLEEEKPRRGVLKRVGASLKDGFSGSPI